MKAPPPPGGWGGAGESNPGDGGPGAGFGAPDDESRGPGAGAGGQEGFATPGEVKPDDEPFVGYDDDPEGPCGYGKIFGVVCQKDAQMFVNDATVWVDAVDCDGNPVHIETLSDQNGFYTLEHVPSGNHTIYVVKDQFEHSYPAMVLEKQITDITAVGHKECFKAVGPDCPLGSITGYVCAPNGTTTIGGATVSVETKDCNGKPVALATLSDGNGNYELAGVPEGTVWVDIKKGSFETGYEVIVPGGGNVHSPDVVQDACFPDETGKLAVVTGDWDTIQQILDGAGLSYDLYDGKDNTQETIDLLSDLEKMNEYDIIFFNCGGAHEGILTFGLNQALIDNVKTFVEQGGSIYASDWAYVYAEFPFPDAIMFFNEALAPMGPKMGPEGPLQGQIVDQTLAQVMGKTIVDLEYDLGAWVVVQGGPAATRIHVTGDVPIAGNGLPLAISHDQGLGTVLYTTFHNEPQVTGDMVQILTYLIFEL